MSTRAKGTPLPARITNRLRLPLIAAPMLRVSGPDLVIAACRAGVIGAFPTANARSVDELDGWLTAIATALATTDDDSFQPGLFDRRAVSRHHASAEERCALTQDGMWYVAMAERAAVIEERPTRAVLVLLP